MRDAQPVKGGVNRMKKKVIAVIAAVLIVVAAAAFIYSAEQRHQAEYEANVENFNRGADSLRWRRE